jgi:hypothetical protein
VWRQQHQSPLPFSHPGCVGSVTWHAAMPPCIVCALKWNSLMSQSPLPLSYTEMYIDDFYNLVQGNACHCHVTPHCILFHAIDDILHPLHSNHPFHQEPILVKKLLQGDGCWSTSKVMLGWWLIDMVWQTLELPPHHYSCLCMIFDELRGARCVCKNITL